ncbi:MAG: hypothetical protein LAO31_00065 [Acidobacteriia bacterium]|nr:hypothetical protein [Terriglobia bacterium]
MKLLKLFFLFILSTLLSVSILVGKAEFTKKEGKPCNYCHTKGKELNELGKCYEKTKNLNECKTPEPKPIKEPKPEYPDDDARR